VSAAELETTITLVTARAEDIQSLVALRIAAMRESLESIGRFDPERAREGVRAGFSPHHTQHIEIDQRRVGFVVVMQDSGWLLLDHLYVHPRYRQGIGAAVLRRVFNDADQLRLPIRVGVLRDSASNRFYMRHGFQLLEQGEFDNYYVRRHRTSGFTD